MLLIGSDRLGARIVAGKPAMAAPLLSALSIHLDGSELRLSWGPRTHTCRARPWWWFFSCMVATHIIVADTEYPRWWH